MFLGQMIADIEDLVVGFGAVGKMEAQVVVECLFQLDRDPALVRPDLYPAVEQLARTQAIKGANKFAGMIVEGLIAFLELVKLFQPLREGKCEMVSGDTPEEAGMKLAVRLRENKVI